MCSPEHFLFPKPVQHSGGRGGKAKDVIDPPASQRSGRVPGSFLFTINVWRIPPEGVATERLITVSVSLALSLPSKNNLKMIVLFLYITIHHVKLWTLLVLIYLVSGKVNKYI